MNWCSIFDCVYFRVLVASSKHMFCWRLGIPLSWWPWWRGAWNLDVPHQSMNFQLKLTRSSRGFVFNLLSGIIFQDRSIFLKSDFSSWHSPDPRYDPKSSIALMLVWVAAGASCKQRTSICLQHGRASVGIYPWTTRFVSRDAYCFS